MKAGRLRHRVTLQTPILVRNSSGQLKVVDWADAGEYDALVTPLSGSEDDTSGQTRAFGNYTVSMRAGPSISPTQRLSYDGRTLNIISISDVREAGRELVIVCREEVTT